MQLQSLLLALEQSVQQWPASDATNPAIEISSLAYDSRKVTPGALFIAVPGAHTDGRLYLGEAAQRGALAAIGPTLEGMLPSGQSAPLPYIVVRDVLAALADLACEFYGYPAQQLCTIGVTGTDGKTTTCNLIHTILRAAGKRAGLMTTANFKLDGQEWENATRQSTLEALEIQQMLRRMVDEGITHAVIEATSHGLELQRVRGCAFDVGVVTNITHEHLDFHKTLENYRRAKARLFEMLDPAGEKMQGRPQGSPLPYAKGLRDTGRPQGSPLPYAKGQMAHKTAILNRDDSSYNILLPYCRVPVLDYGIDAAAAVRAVDVRLDADRTRFRAVLPDGEIDIETQLVGQFNISNCLAAIATAYSQGIAPDIIAGALASVAGVAGRMERIDEGQPFTVIVDYAHTPDSMAKVLVTLRPLTRGKLMVVFGSAGERDVLKRPIMGQIAAQMADFFVITDEDPREEDREKILREIAAGSEAAGKQEGRDFLCIADRTQAIAAALARAQAGDTILLAGKGHEQSIITGREKILWDDRRVAREQLRSL